MVTLSDVLQTSSSSSSLLAAAATLAAVPQEPQQGADKSVVVTSPPQCGGSIPPSADHNNITTTANSEHNLVNSGGGGGFERLEIFVEDEEHSQENVLPPWLREGAPVTVGSNKAGTVRYVGVTQFAEGTWVGVELDAPVGRAVSSSQKLRSQLEPGGWFIRFLLSLQVKMTVRSGVIATSTASRVSGCWSGPAGWLLVAAQASRRKPWGSPAMSPSCVETAWLAARLRIANPGVAERGSGAGWGGKPPTAVLLGPPLPAMQRIFRAGARCWPASSSLTEERQ